jgi:hypothetical protein
VALEVRSSRPRPFPAFEQYQHPSAAEHHFILRSVDHCAVSSASVPAPAISTLPLPRGCPCCLATSLTGLSAIGHILAVSAEGQPNRTSEPVRASGQGQNGGCLGLLEVPPMYPFRGNGKLTEAEYSSTVAGRGQLAAFDLARGGGGGAGYQRPDQTRAEQLVTGSGRRTVAAPSQLPGYHRSVRETNSQGPSVLASPPPCFCRCRQGHNAQAVSSSLQCASSQTATSRTPCSWPSRPRQVLKSSCFGAPQSSCRAPDGSPGTNVGARGTSTPPLTSVV